MRALAWDRATGYLASLGGDPHDRTLRLWDPASGQCLGVLDLPGAADALAMIWHSERRSISVTTADGWIFTWSVAADDGSADAELLAHPVRALTTEERRSAGLQAD
ncbi:hypothetical protein [Actinoplanes auranticolor]|uniref:WD40 repeat protein n=1 Tax=Actinoplanes auranticolor TaxID=47988 RepID=A0A919SAR3_9ACTN|nr:hypothetical protein [Actinoplanes auranticolor]GIM68127.1 hypothetical protein Aau02nite_30250 [Actinoplanes auranticolor]